MLYVLSWSAFVRCTPDDEVGSAAWLPPLEPHYVRNVGEGTLHIIAVEVKNS